MYKKYKIKDEYFEISKNHRTFLQEKFIEVGFNRESSYYLSQYFLFNRFVCIPDFNNEYKKIMKDVLDYQKAHPAYLGFFGEDGRRDHAYLIEEVLYKIVDIPDFSQNRDIERHINPLYLTESQFNLLVMK